MKFFAATVIILIVFMSPLVRGEVYNSADANQAAPSVSDKQPQFPIVAPPASEVLARLRKMGNTRLQPKQRNEDSPQIPIFRRLTKTGAFIGVSQPQCSRSIPTRSEFLRMVKKHPADANQIAQTCNPDLSSICPLRQLATGTRRLPEDTRQRSVGTWNH